jgi:signal-transduction protein with cAMP-binding, CBS, and nucleotidyltransferase domain
MKTGIKVIDAMTKKPVSVTQDDTVRSCTQLMLDRHVGSLLVKDGEKLLGFLTERDLVRMISMGVDPNTTRVKQIMTKKIVAISPEKDIYDAIVLMNKENVRRLPVIINNKIIGLITVRDILTIQPTLFELIMDKVSIGESHRLM